MAVAGSSEESRDDMPQSDNDTVSETTSSNPPKTGKKSKSQAQVEREELADKIINFASKEDHPVDLALAALCSKIKRKLPDPDDQDNLLDEIKDVARAFFQRKKRAANSNSTVQPVRQTPPPPSSSSDVSTTTATARTRVWRYDKPVQHRQLFNRWQFRCNIHGLIK